MASLALACPHSKGPLPHTLGSFPRSPALAASCRLSVLVTSRPRSRRHPPASRGLSSGSYSAQQGPATSYPFCPGGRWQLLSGIALLRPGAELLGDALAGGEVAVQDPDLVHEGVIHDPSLELVANKFSMSRHSAKTERNQLKLQTYIVETRE